MMYTYLVALYRYFTHFLSPPACFFCTTFLAVRQPLCSSCVATILPIVPFDLYCGKNQTITVFAISAYKDPLRAFILAKHHNNETAIRYLADFVADHSLIEQLDFDIITFIPLHWTRYASRGFNQAHIIAQAVAHATGKTIVPLIIRSKRTE